MDRGIDYLWGKMNPTGFHWEPQTMAEWEKWVKAHPDNKEVLTVGGLHGGFTALTLLALVKAGVSPDDERFAESLKWLAISRSTRPIAGHAGGHAGQHRRVQA